MPKKNEEPQIYYLKPCPFCGGEAGRNFIYNVLQGYAQIVCKSCGASTKAFRVSIDYSAVGEAIAAWNKRREEI